MIKPTSTFPVKEEVDLITFLLQNIPGKTRNSVKILLKYKKIRVDDQVIKQYNYQLKPGQKVEVSWEKKVEKINLPGIRIVHEDNDILIVDKSEGVLSIATDKETSMTAYSILSSYVKIKNPKNKIFVIHRLDRDTSGLMIFAKNQAVQEILQNDWQENIIERSYVAVLEGIISPPEGTITSWLTESKAFIVYSSQNPELGKKAITHYETMEKNEHYSLVKVNLETGRKNQIRVHMQDKKTPVIGDKKYGAKTNPIQRLGLHAWVLGFKHPVTHQELHFNTSIPAKFVRLVR